ncbi:MAG: putative toxin-antitoxin system toxin component, PIN family [Candidatus Daviesbacteria bacterium]|nr:putative toxin-antitoxin system toxin component, PIN family [Candidatus Daviesbacteria bacterium]
MKKKNRQSFRAVIDTNLLISAVIAPKGLPNKLIRAWQKDHITLIFSPKLIRELEEVSQRDKFKQYHLFNEQIIELIDNIKAFAEIVPSIPEEQLPIRSRDSKDDKLLACALSANVDYLITGDEDLLILNENSALGNLKIITAKDFLNLLTI